MLKEIILQTQSKNSNFICFYFNSNCYHDYIFFFFDNISYLNGITNVIIIIFILREVKDSYGGGTLYTFYIYKIIYIYI